jgi:hypothetical protein
MVKNMKVVMHSCGCNQVIDKIKVYVVRCLSYNVKYIDGIFYYFRNIGIRFYGISCETNLVLIHKYEND